MSSAQIATEATSAASLRARVAALPVGATICEASRVEDVNPKEIEDEVERLRNIVNPGVARAKAQTGNTYTIEQGSFLSRGRGLLIVFAITRLS